MAKRTKIPWLPSSQSLENDSAVTPKSQPKVVRQVAKDPRLLNMHKVGPAGNLEP